MFLLPLGFQETLVLLLHHKSRHFSSTVPGRFNFPTTNSFAELIHAIVPPWSFRMCSSRELCFLLGIWLSWRWPYAKLTAWPCGWFLSVPRCPPMHRICACQGLCNPLYCRWQSLAISISQDVLYMVEPICGSCGLFFLIESAACLLEAAAAAGIRIIAYFSRKERSAGQ